MSAELHDSFWKAEGRKELLIQASVAIRAKLLLSEEELNDFFRALNIPDDMRPQARTMRRLHSGQQTSLRQLRQLSGWLAGLLGYLRDPAHRKQISESVLGQLDRLASEYLEILGARPEEMYAATPREPPTQQEWSTLSFLLQRYLHVNEASLSAVRACFFDNAPEPEGRDEVHFNMYRYHSIPGHIAKSFTAILGPSVNSPVCTFANFFREDASESNPRRTSGVVLPMGNFINIIAEMDRGQGLAVMCIRKPIRPKNWYSGLLLSYDDYHTPIASRFVMSRTDGRAHDPERIGVFKETLLETEIAGFRDELLNHVPVDPKNERAGAAALRMFSASS